MTDVVTYDVVPRAGVIDLGKQVEGLVTRVVLPNVRRGEGAVQLVHQRADDQKPYLVPITEDGDRAYWIVSRLDTAYPGRGQAELQWLGVNGEVAKSVTYQTNTTRSMAEPGAVPDEPLRPYTQAVAKDAQAAKDAAASATESARSAEASATQAGLSADNAAKSLKQLEDGIASGDFRGQDGKSAYQLAVDAGFDGTETQWLESLKGAPGDTTAADAAAAAAQKSAEDAQKNATAAQAAALEAQKAAETAVLYTEQNLTDSQQEQARSNISAADKARQNILFGAEIGNPIAVDDAFSAPLCGLTVYGKSTQDGTPTPDAPVPIVNAGDGGTITVTIGDGADKRQTITLQTPNGLPGIPVVTNGNYTDQSGQQWVCDEVDLERGVKVQRIGKAKIKRATVSSDPKWFDANKSYSYEIREFTLTFLDSYTFLKTELCDRFIMTLFNGFYNRGIETGGLAGFRYAVFNISKTFGICTTVEEFTAWFNENVVLYKILATPIETPLTPAEIAAYKAITAYAPDTVMQASDGAGVKLEYQRDVNIAIKKLEDAVASMTAT